MISKKTLAIEGWNNSFSEAQSALADIPMTESQRRKIDSNLSDCRYEFDKMGELVLDEKITSAARERLEKIASATGAFSRDPLQHATNVIQENVETAQGLLVLLKSLWQ